MKKSKRATPVPQSRRQAKVPTSYLQRAPLVAIGLFLAILLALSTRFLGGYFRTSDVDSITKTGKASPDNLDPVVQVEKEPAPPFVWDEAIAKEKIEGTLKELVQSYPDDFATYHLQGIVEARMSRSQAAEKSYRAGIQRAPQYVPLREDLAELLMQVGRDEEAKKGLEEVPQGLQTSARYAQLLGEAHVRLGELDRAREVLSEGVRRFPSVSTLWIHLGELELQREEWDSAESSLKKSIELDRNSERAWLAMSQVLAMQKRNDEASAARQELMRCRKQMLEQRKTFEESHDGSMRSFLGSSFRSVAVIHQKHQSNRVKEFLDLASAIQPDDPQTLGMLASYHRRSGNLRMAVEVSEKLVKLQPDVWTGYANLSSLYMEVGQVDQAEKKLVEAVSKNLGNGQSHLRLAQFFLATERPHEALNYAKEAVERLKSADAYFVWCSSAERSGDLKSAREAREQAKRSYPQDPRFHEMGRL